MTPRERELADRLIRDRRLRAEEYEELLAERDAETAGYLAAAAGAGREEE